MQGSRFKIQRSLRGLTAQELSFRSVCNFDGPTRNVDGAIFEVQCCVLKFTAQCATLQGWKNKIQCLVKFQGFNISQSFKVEGASFKVSEKKRKVQGARHKVQGWRFNSQVLMSKGYASFNGKIDGSTWKRRVQNLKIIPQCQWREGSRLMPNIQS